MAFLLQLILQTYRYQTITYPYQHLNTNFSKTTPCKLKVKIYSNILYTNIYSPLIYYRGVFEKLVFKVLLWCGTKK